MKCKFLKYKIFCSMKLSISMNGITDIGSDTGNNAIIIFC